MDDQNNPVGGAPTDQGGGQTPPAADQPAEAPAADTGGAAVEEKCVTCGNQASGGNCVACGQGVVTCTCQPAGGSEPSGSGPVMGGGEPQGAPVM